MEDLLNCLCCLCNSFDCCDTLFTKIFCCPCRCLCNCPKTAGEKNSAKVGSEVVTSQPK